MRNKLSMVRLAGADVWLARTGYTGEPVCFEMFVSREQGPALWDALLGAGAAPVGLGARDTLRLEAGLPLYGQELGSDPSGDGDPRVRHPAGQVRRQLLTAQGRLRRQGGAGHPAGRLQAHRVPRLLAAARPAADGAADRPGRARHRPPGRRGQPLRAPGRLGDERHHGAALEGRGRGPGAALHRRTRAAPHRPRPRRLRHRRRRPRHRRHPRQAGRGRGRRVAPAQRRAALRTADRLGSPVRPAAAAGAPGRSRARAAPRCRRQHRVAAAALRQPHPVGDDRLPRRPPPLRDGSVLPLRRAPRARGLLRRRRLLLPGDGLHRPRRAAGRRAAQGVPGLPGGGGARHQRPDGQRRRLQRHRRVPQPRRPQGRAAAPAHGHEPPHRQGRPPERPADGRPARLRRP